MVSLMLCLFGSVCVSVSRRSRPVCSSACLTPAVTCDLCSCCSCRAHRGLRHYWGLRVKGQHTKTTGRRGKTVGVAKKK